MLTIQSINEFLLSEWLWNITWGMYHIPINFIMMFFLLKFFGQMKIISSILLSFFGQLFSLSLYTGFVVGVLIYGLGIDFQQNHQFLYEPMHVLLICFSLAAIHSCIQIIFYTIISNIYNLNNRLLLLITITSNVLSTLLVYLFLDLTLY